LIYCCSCKTFCSGLHDVVPTRDLFYLFVNLVVVSRGYSECTFFTNVKKVIFKVSVFCSNVATSVVELNTSGVVPSLTSVGGDGCLSLQFLDLSGDVLVGGILGAWATVPSCRRCYCPRTIWMTSFRRRLVGSRTCVLWMCPGTV